MSMRRHICLAAAVALAVLAVNPRVDASDDELRLRAQLSGDAVMKGNAVFRERPRNGTIERRFKVEVEHGVPHSSHEIYADGYFAGIITLNQWGRAEFQLRTPQFIDSPGDGLPMPADFPALEEGDPIIVGHLGGVLFIDDGGGSSGGGVGTTPSRRRYQLRGRSRVDGVEVNVNYLERSRRGALLRKFKVEVENAIEGEQFDVFVNDIFVTTLIIDAFEEAEFELRTPAFIDSPDDGLPMGDDFPSLVEGDVVTVGPFTAILGRRR